MAKQRPSSRQQLPPWPLSKADKRAIANGCWYDPAPLERFKKFCAGYVVHTMEGADGGSGRPFVPLPWEERLAGTLLGWRRKDGRRRFEKAYISMSKKNGKSTFLAVLTVFLLLSEGPRSKILSAATDREQAGIIFDEAQAVVNASPALASAITVKASTKTLVYGDSLYRALSSDAERKEGFNANVVIIDELHAWKDRRLFDTLAYAGSARREALTLIITTAGDDLQTVWGEEYTRAKRWLAGEWEDDTYLAMIWEAEPADDWTLPATWAKANPSLGHTITTEKLETECREAKEIPAAQARFKRYRCNMLVSLESTWLNMTAWDQCPAQIDLAALAGASCTAGLDLSSVNDTTALLRAFDGEDGNVIVVPTFWIPAMNVDELSRKHKVSYRAWIEQGWMRTTEGNCVDYDQIIADILELNRTSPIRQLAIDRLFQGQHVETKLVEAGLDVVPVGQGWVSQSLPAKELERLVLARQLNHGGHPVLRHHANNTVAKRDDQDNISISKRRSRGKIDGIAALLMALLCRLKGTPTAATPQYDTAPVMTFK